jgi:mRNA-degrading endonuclease HigB of HigAB toxin-antitoxin module
MNRHHPWLVKIKESNMKVVYTFEWQSGSIQVKNHEQMFTSVGSTNFFHVNHACLQNPTNEKLMLISYIFFRHNTILVEQMKEL